MAFQRAPGASSGPSHEKKRAVGSIWPEKVWNSVSLGGLGRPFSSSDRMITGELEAKLGRESALRTLGEQVGGDHAFTTAEEIAAQIGFLLSDAAANITGQVLVSDGGYSL